MIHTLDLTDVRRLNIRSLGPSFSGKDADGHTIGFTTHYMAYDGTPFFLVSGEMHFCRVQPDQWEDSIVKMKAGGINVLSTYVFWIVHEETQGVFRFDGFRDLRKFLSLCKKHNIWVILRIGPFAHGEMRNGRLPDWLYGKPFEVRSNDPIYLDLVKKYYQAVHQQADGFYFSQNGPVIAIQLENEYMHSAAPWEAYTAGSSEWIPCGRDGDSHLKILKDIAQNIGMNVPFYTATAWGGAAAPSDSVLPLWGGYSYRPWIFYSRKGKHPPTPEYDYRDYHNDAQKITYNFEPQYPPESVPYACCEMMGGMFCSYNYRFSLPFESVDALANIKIGSGCSMLGYYMFRGGTTPCGDKVLFLNEGQVPQRTYDFQSPVGEYGQIRTSFYRLRILHFFCKMFQAELTRSVTVIPLEEKDPVPDDPRHLRWCVKIDGESGFVFINNFQDHFHLPERSNECIVLSLPSETLHFPAFSLACGENAVLPFNLHMDGLLLKSCTAQPVGKIKNGDEFHWFFMSPAGMQPVFIWDAYNTAAAEGCPSEEKGRFLVCRPCESHTFSVNSDAGKIYVTVLSREDALKFSILSDHKTNIAVLSDAPVLQDGDRTFIEITDDPINVMTYPPHKIVLQTVGSDIVSSLSVKKAEKDIFSGFQIRRLCRLSEGPTINKIHSGKYTVFFPDHVFAGHKTVLLRIWYSGDVGQAFAGNIMISDNYSNGNPWDIRVDCLKEALCGEPMTLIIVPDKEDAFVMAETAMAGRSEHCSGATAVLEKIQLIYIDDVDLSVV